MLNCKKCANAENFYYGLEGKRFSESKILIVLHHSDRRVDESENYLNVLSKTWTGKALRSVLKSCGLDFEDVFITNFVKCTFPKYVRKKTKDVPISCSWDWNPGKEVYRNCRSVLEKQIEELSPKVILFFGQKNFENIFEGESGKISESFGKELNYKNIPCLVNLHPSKIYPYSHERRVTHYEPIQDFLSKYSLCRKLTRFPKQMKIRF